MRRLLVYVTPICYGNHFYVVWVRNAAKVVLWIVVIATIVYMSVTTPWADPQDSVTGDASLVHNSELCRDGAPQLLVLVRSPPHHRLLRDAIRDTWGGAAASRDVAVGFLLDSRELPVQEVSQYRDVVVGHLSPVLWAATYCPQARYVLVMSDDVFVNVPKLLQFARQHPQINTTLFGDRDRFLLTGDSLAVLKSGHDVFEASHERGVSVLELGGLLETRQPADPCGVLAAYTLSGVDRALLHRYWWAVSDPDKCPRLENDVAF